MGKTATEARSSTGDLHHLLTFVRVYPNAALQCSSTGAATMLSSLQSNLANAASAIVDGGSCLVCAEADALRWHMSGSITCEITSRKGCTRPYGAEFRC
jgi:hypothetical protein